MVLAGISATRQLVLARWLSSFQLAVTLPLASGLDISKLERAVQAGRGNAAGLQGVWRTLCRQVKQNGSDIPRYTYWSLKQGYRGGICAWGGGLVYKHNEEHVVKWRHSSYHTPRKTEGVREDCSREIHRHQQQYGDQHVYHHHLRADNAYYIHMPSREQYKVRWTWVLNLVCHSESTVRTESRRRWPGTGHLRIPEKLATVPAEIKCIPDYAARQRRSIPTRWFMTV